MKIAQIAPLMESVPPQLYGGTERIVSYLTDELVRLGHEVILFASADSVTAAKLVNCASMALRLDSNVRDPIPYYMLMLDRVRKLARDPTLGRSRSPCPFNSLSKPGRGIGTAVARSDMVGRLSSGGMQGQVCRTPLPRSSPSRTAPANRSETKAPAPRPGSWSCRAH